jgi:hypothetical protein
MKRSIRLVFRANQSCNLQGATFTMMLFSIAKPRINLSTFPRKAIENKIVIWFWGNISRANG